MVFPFSRYVVFALFLIALPANAQLSVPPATYQPPAASRAQVEPSLLLPSGAAARSIVLSTPTPQESAKLAPKAATVGSKDGVTPKRRRMIIGFARQVDPAQGSFSLSDLAWAQTADGMQVAHVDLTSSGAAALRLGIVLAGVPPGLEMRFKGSGSSQVFGPYPADVARDSVYWSPVLEGERGTIELSLPSGVNPDGGTVSVPLISHLVIAGNALRQADPLHSIGLSESC
jgi:hypothetical protein